MGTRYLVCLWLTQRGRVSEADTTPITTCTVSLTLLSMIINAQGDNV
jgi:hypothetical protein